MRRQKVMYWFFAAAYSGCMTCVRACVEDLQMNPAVAAAEDMEHTAMDWAQYGVGKKVKGTQEVLNYLQTRSQ